LDAAADFADKLGGGWAGVRPQLAARGASVGFDYTAEVFHVASGGLKRGAAAQGLVALTLGAGMEKLAGWPGVTAHVHVYDTHGPSASQKNAGYLGHLSNIEFADSARLFGCWVQRTWAEAGVSLRVGQLALGFAGLQWSPAARGALRDANAFNRVRNPVPDGEHVVELTWRAEVRPGWALQPDVQWIRHPGGSSAIPDVLAVGLRTSLSF